MIGPYAASKWALEAIAETLAIETGHFGIKVSVMQPGAVSSGGGERAKVFLTENDPYAPLYEALGVLRGESVTPQDVAAAVADTIEQPSPPLCVPVGVPAKRGPAGPQGGARDRAVPAGRDQLVAGMGEWLPAVMSRSPDLLRSLG
jgi:hypothetical protein